ncbi:HD domain-containing protein [Sunxiuqinia dokdonensis]|uniref:Phosphohydrolase n=1 Tax=Sunxiuqinia dokdonensis TaxID=1409788 RepID=A0A0L8V8H4_9BACT|nr:HD domain-containing protein [Sunxiuqinia dokdonensis]KOH44744.1 phosphohydrolase [Sunxiuqinia dokdonensis]
MRTNKKKIINDPVFGFITIQSEFIYDLIEHPFLQRLRRIKQLGLSSIVFPGVNHTRFEHAIGAVHLMRLAISGLIMKGVEISDDEAEAVTAAILLHDIGHGPFSHALEHSLVEGISHEMISLLLMEELNRQFNGRLEMAIQIFKNEYPKRFLHQLVASQLDVDRLDYLRRDSFFSGVTEGMIGSDRIIKMLNVRNDGLVIEHKGIYSIEKFLISRRLMYWQVYLHKTVLSAENMLVKVLQRAKTLVMQGHDLCATPALKVFMGQKITWGSFKEQTFANEKSLLDLFVELDDSDLISAMKQWQYHDDKILAYLAGAVINRKLFRIRIQNTPFSDEEISGLKNRITDRWGLDGSELDYFLIHDSISNFAYTSGSDKINILMKDGRVQEINEASDVNLSSLLQTVRKYFVCYPKELDIK